MQTFSLTAGGLGVQLARNTAAEKGVRKRSPLEQAIAEKVDRRARYDAKQRQLGLKRSTVWCREDLLPVVLAFVRAANEAGRDPTAERDARSALAALSDQLVARS